MSFISFKFNRGSGFILILFILASFCSYAQCPVVSNTTQAFCDINNPRVSSLSASPAVGETDVRWYISQSATTPLGNDTKLTDGEIYYAGNQNALSCLGTSRPSVTVTILGTPPSFVDVAASKCSAGGDTVGQLRAEGSNIAWYSERTGGILLPPSTLLEDEETYWVQQTEDDGTTSCTSIRLPTTITIIDPGAPSGEPEQFFCSNPAAPTTYTIADLIATGDDIRWYSSLTSSTPLDSTTVLENNTSYFATQSTFPCESVGRYETIVRIQNLQSSGTNTDLNLCDDSSASINLLSVINGSNGGLWTGSPSLANGDLGTLDTSLLDLGTYQYTYTISQNNACTETSSTATVIVSEAQSAGEDNSLAICSNEPPVDLFNLLGGSPNTGGSWSPPLASGSGVFNPNIDSSGEYRYTLTARGGCLEDVASIFVNLSNAPNTGSDATLDICNDGSSVDLLTLLGAGVDSGGSWSGPSVLGNGDLGTFSPSTNIRGIYTYTLAGSGACQNITATVTVNRIDPLPSILQGDNVFCSPEDATVENLTDRILPEASGTINIYESSTATTSLSQNTRLTSGTTYFISETDRTFSCEGSRRLSITIQIKPKPPTPLLTSNNVKFCLIDKPDTRDLNTFLVTNTSVVWIDNDGESLETLDPLVAGSYYAIEIDSDGCRSDASELINVIINDISPPSQVEFGGRFCGVDRPTLEDLEADLNFSSDYSIRWYATISDDSQLNKENILTDKRTYYAATFDEVTQCESSQRLLVTVDLTFCNPELYPLLLPDGFSPNGDGINDTFDLVDVNFLYEDYTIQIYNRYGTIVFEGNNNSVPWDGTTNQPAALGSSIVPNGVYFYIFNYNRYQTRPIQGRLYLNR